MLKTSAKEKTFFDDFIFRNFIPKDHKLVKIKDFLNLDFIPALVKDAYNNENPAGRNPIDPKIIFMACLLEFIEAFNQVIKQLKEAGLISGQLQSQAAADMRADIALLNVFQRKDEYSVFVSHTQLERQTAVSFNA
ncbi:hypothetical protein HZC34_00270 [Candidatus Saganbacteria bacterium]|nr:hypothetical protein [Candidatus Saganbacteria bacterium]